MQVTHFRSSLSKALAGLARKYATDIAEQEADRLTPILTSLSGRCCTAWLHVLDRVAGMQSLRHSCTLPFVGLQRPSQTTRHGCRYLGTSYGAEGALAGRDAVSAAQLPQLAAQSFPLCMQHMYGSVRSAHHLHHQGRLQLGLFLKVGFPLPGIHFQWHPDHAAVRSCGGACCACSGEDLRRILLCMQRMDVSACQHLYRTPS